jgi:hypothetical protein
MTRREAARERARFESLSPTDGPKLPGGEMEGVPRLTKPASLLVPRGGLEPPRPCGLRILSPLRLPISPSGHMCFTSSKKRTLTRSGRKSTQQLRTTLVSFGASSTDLCRVSIA